ncbi:hypothetical protein [Streptomyces pactum]|uniref:hypothetical protein n=1 Tax=Streptomyces pactum TaxID=68249 RepID=UPI0036F6D74C
MLRRSPVPRAWAAGAVDVFHPLVTVSRGVRRLAARARQTWEHTPKDRRSPLVFLVAAAVLAVGLIPYGPPLALLGLMGAAAWAGRGAPAPAPDPGAGAGTRLQLLHDALVPYFTAPQDAAPLYRHGGHWQTVFEEHETDGTGRPVRLLLRYPAYFTDGEPESRARVEQLLCGKCGRDREYRFRWDQEENRLEVAALPQLPTGVPAQRFVTAAGETVLGFTDPTGTPRTLPVVCPGDPDGGDGPDGAGTVDVPAVVWRTGARSAEQHLLVLGRPGSGATTLLRSVAIQALTCGDVLVVDGAGTGEYAFLAGRSGVLAVESGLSGTLATLEWAAHETERRLIATSRARQLGRLVPGDVHRPLWIILDRPTELSRLAAAEGRPDPQRLLEVPLRQGRAANVTVVVADQDDGAEALAAPVRALARARVVLGAAGHRRIGALLGAVPDTSPPGRMPPGRGYVRLGSGPVRRLQVPDTPDPYDAGAAEPLRRAVLELLPEPAGGAERPPAEATEAVPAGRRGTEDEADGALSGTGS